MPPYFVIVKSDEPIDVERFLNLSTGEWVDNWREATQLHAQDSTYSWDDEEWVIKDMYCPGPRTIVVNNKTKEVRDLRHVTEPTFHLEKKVVDTKGKMK